MPSCQVFVQERTFVVQWSRLGGVGVPRIQVTRLPSRAQEQHLAVTSRVVFQKVLLALSTAFPVSCVGSILDCVHGLRLDVRALPSSHVQLQFPIDL